MAWNYTLKDIKVWSNLYKHKAEALDHNLPTFRLCQDYAIAVSLLHMPNIQLLKRSLSYKSIFCGLYICQSSADYTGENKDRAFWGIQFQSYFGGWFESKPFTHVTKTVQQMAWSTSAKHLPMPYSWSGFLERIWGPAIKPQPCLCEFIKMKTATAISAIIFNRILYKMSHWKEIVKKPYLSYLLNKKHWSVTVTLKFNNF